VAQLVECPTLDFGPSHDLRVVRSSPIWGSVLGLEPNQDSLSLSLLLPLSKKGERVREIVPYSPGAKERDI